jgi:hypothetical protein
MSETNLKIETPHATLNVAKGKINHSFNIFDHDEQSETTAWLSNEIAKVLAVSLGVITQDFTAPNFSVAPGPYPNKRMEIMAHSGNSYWIDLDPDAQEKLRVFLQ